MYNANVTGHPFKHPPFLIHCFYSLYTLIKLQHYSVDPTQCTMASNVPKIGKASVPTWPPSIGSQFRIEFKVLLFVFKALHDTAPYYISDFSLPPFHLQDLKIF